MRQENRGEENRGELKYYLGAKLESRTFVILCDKIILESNNIVCYIILTSYAVILLF